MRPRRRLEMFDRLKIKTPKKLLGLFIFGAAWDAIIAWSTWEISHGNSIRAGLAAIVLTIWSIEFYSKALSGGMKWDRVIALALGSGFGTLILVEFIK